MIECRGLQCRSKHDAFFEVRIHSRRRPQHQIAGPGRSAADPHQRDEGAPALEVRMDVVGGVDVGLDRARLERGRRAPRP